MTPSTIIDILPALADSSSMLLLWVVPGFVAVVLWSPILVSSRLRSLFRHLPLTGSLVGSYVIVGFGLALPFIAGTAVALVRLPQATVSNAILDTVVQTAVVYAVGLPLLAGDILPKLGIDWDPSGYGGRTWFLLLGSVVWYIAVFAVPLSFLAVLLAIPH